RTEFSCGQDDLDRFFHHYASQNQFKFHLAMNYVAVAGNRVLGFATVTVGAVERGNLPNARMRKRLPAYPLPVLRLARLAVDTRARRLGIGKALLRHVLSLALEQRDRFGCVGVVTDAKPDALPFYEAHGFVPFPAALEGLLQGEPTPMFLSLGAIEQAPVGP
ncbi:MAG TPA: GNAT family N-acetyltransferase, partial [Polyangiaceae bacterium]